LQWNCTNILLAWKLKTLGSVCILGKVQCPFTVLCHPDTWEQHHAHSILDLLSPGQCQGQCPGSTFPRFPGLSQPTLLPSPLLSQQLSAATLDTGHIIQHLPVLRWRQSVLSPSCVSHTPSHSTARKLRAGMAKGPFVLPFLHLQDCQVKPMPRDRNNGQH